MDALQHPDDYPFISTEIVVKDFYDLALPYVCSVLYNVGQGLSENEMLADTIGCSPDVIAELQSVCSVENLKCGLEDGDDPLSSKIPDGVELNTLNIQKEELNKRRQDLPYRQMQLKLLRFQRANFDITRPFRETGEANVSKLPGAYVPPDVVLTVNLFKPFNEPLEAHKLRSGRVLRLDTTFLVVGQTPLTALRDRISCLADMAVNEDFSLRPEMRDAEGNILSHELYKSSFFYINGTFYNDMREQTACDISLTIREWCEKTAKELGPFETAKMESTNFIDLKLRLGLPYLYLHQGTCEHLMVFSDLRMLHPHDAQDPAEYPLQTSEKMKKRVSCCACKLYTAKWVTYQNGRLPLHPGFFCEDCFRKFNYTSDRKKKCDFKAGPYYDRQSMT